MAPAQIPETTDEQRLDLLENDPSIMLSIRYNHFGGVNQYTYVTAQHSFGSYSLRRLLDSCVYYLVTLPQEKP